ncbi:MAG: hypothetical protein Q7S22_07205 [Candidatus Micrarchaeota archaeon]|nr:hypothetical protein [Candidatus Micrarchaeota archaeon]
MRLKFQRSTKNILATTAIVGAFVAGTALSYWGSKNATNRAKTSFVEKHTFARQTLLDFAPAMSRCNRESQSLGQAQPEAMVACTNRAIAKVDLAFKESTLAEQKLQNSGHWGFGIGFSFAFAAAILLYSSAIVEHLGKIKALFRVDIISKSIEIGFK